MREQAYGLRMPVRIAKLLGAKSVSTSDLLMGVKPALSDSMPISNKGVFRDERGITTIGMAVSIFLCLVLIFTSAQLYRVSSASSEIQEVADVSALAASNEVAEFVSVVNVCDAAILSLTLLSGTLFGLGIVTACVPPLVAMSDKLIKAADQIMERRDRFYESAIKGLNTLQRLLPFLSAANAMGVAKANDQGAMEASYFALSVLVPEKGVEFESKPDEGLASLSESVDNNIDAIREDSEKAEEVAKRANEAKERAFARDCGDSPGVCMHERAEKLSDISNSDNALYTNVDAWSFQVPLKRIRAYYSDRKNDPVATDGTIESRADSVIRKRFYEYAYEEFSSAFIDDGESGFAYSLPKLFKNTDEMKETPLYTEVRYPVSQDGSGQMMHAWSGCPKASGATRLGSISEMDAAPASYLTCPYCEFRVSSMGNVAAATTNTKTGFEYHYRFFLQAVEDYAKAREELDPLNDAVKRKVEPLFDALKTVFKDAVAKRFIADPPGRYGAIVMVVNTAKLPADSGFESMFVRSGATLGATAAVSASTLLKDSGSDGSSAITRIIGNLVGDVSVLAGLGDVVANGWTGLLRAYSSGQESLNKTIEEGLKSFSTSTASGLGIWVSNALRNLVYDVGLQPADIDPRLPVLVNTGHVASNGGSFSTNFMQVKQAALAGSSSSTGLFSALSSIAAESLHERTDSVWVNVSSFDSSQSGEGYSIEWMLPNIGASSSGLLDEAIGSLQRSVAGLDPVRSWQ